MTRAASDHSERIEIRIRFEEKNRIRKAAAISGLDMASFVRHHAISAAKEVIESEGRLVLSERDAKRLMEYLDGPAEPNEKLLQAARSLPKDALR